MADRRSGRRAVGFGRASEGPQRLAEVLTDVLARYGYDVRPQEEERPQARFAAAAGTPIRQLELFNDAGLAAMA